MKFDKDIVESGTQGFSQDSVRHITSASFISATTSNSQTLLITERTLASNIVGRKKSLLHVMSGAAMVDKLGLSSMVSSKAEAPMVGEDMASPGCSAFPEDLSS